MGGMGGICQGMGCMGGICQGREAWEVYVRVWEVCVKVWKLENVFLVSLC